MKDIITKVVNEAFWINSAKLTNIFDIPNGDYAFGINSKVPFIYVRNLGNEKFEVFEYRTITEVQAEFWKNIDFWYEQTKIQSSYYYRSYSDELSLEGLKRYKKNNESSINIDKYLRKHLELDSRVAIKILQMKGTGYPLFNLYIKNVRDNIGKVELFDLLVSKNKLSLNAFEKIYGEVTQSTERIKRFQHGKWDIYFDLKTKRDVSELTELLDDCGKILNGHNFEKLIGGKIMATDNLGGQVLADYDIQSGNIRIGFKELKRSNKQSNIDSLLHEIGHKNWYKFMDSNVKSDINLKFYEIKHGSSEVKVGESIIDKKFDTMFKIKKYQYSRGYSGYYVAELQMIGKKFKEKDIGKDFRIPDEYIGTVYVSQTASDKDKNRSSYVPDVYGLSKVEEFYAVLFSNYLLGVLKNPAKEWFESLF